VLNHYFDMHSDEIYAKHSDIFTDEGAEKATLTELAARVMGREIKAIAQRDEKLFVRIANILDVNTADASTSKMAEIMVQYFNNTIEENLRLLQYLKKGLTSRLRKIILSWPLRSVAVSSKNFVPYLYLLITKILKYKHFYFLYWEVAALRVVRG